MTTDLTFNWLVSREAHAAEYASVIVPKLEHIHASILSTPVAFVALNTKLRTGCIHSRDSSTSHTYSWADIPGHSATLHFGTEQKLSNPAFGFQSMAMLTNA